MKILSISQSDLDGGAARAAHRLANRLFEMDVDLKMLVMKKLGKDGWVLGPKKNYQSFVARLLPWLDLKAKQFLGVDPRYSWSLNIFPNPLLNKGFVNGFDVIHLNWVGRNMFPVGWARNLKRPVVWTLHDSWAFTGGCHVPAECRRFMQTCGLCPQLITNGPRDISSRIWLKKAAAYRKLPLHIIAPSRWIAEEARASSLLNCFPLSVIPNGLDTSVFSPRGKSETRGALNFPKEKRIILFGSTYSDIDRNKGLDLLIEALNILVNSDAGFAARNLLVVTGTDNVSISRLFPLPTVCLGFIKDENRLAQIYSAADLTIVPSRSESFGQVASESLSCGTPVVAFNTTGLKDIIVHLETGYLANVFQTEDLANGIKLLSEDAGLCERMSPAARLRAVEHFDINVVARMHLALFERLRMV